MTTREARCGCGNLMASCEGEPVKVSLCHCLECQKRTGSTYGIAAFFKGAQVQCSGEAKSYERASDSGHPVTFSFCPRCGSTVYWKPERMPDLIAVAVGAFADPDFPPPEQQVYENRKHPWVRCANLEMD